MDSELERKLQRIRSFSQVFRRICQGALLVMFLLLLACIAGICIGRGGIVRAFDISIPLSTLSGYQRILMAVVAVLAIAVPIKGLYHLERLFRNYTEGKIFTVASAGEIRQLGITALLWAAANLIWIAAAVVLTERRLPHSFYFRMDSIAIGVTVIVISWLMEMAAAMREENELTI
ncbi:DUF2975 domain-containing protein [Terriglobus albidus]|uniref:DUF2975 domain-containing protein n=2 Tax=Terriglobus albidus TaxID=1592106 RepID=A0A5B9E9F6_9BACT|nr:DUF2975 domain-containing protein [Terriglobus albidus]